MDEYQVIIKLECNPNNLRLTYKNNKTKTIVEIEEVNALEETLCSCKFKGRSTNKDISCGWLSEIKRFAGQMKPDDWLVNPDNYIDSHYKIH